MPVRLSCELYPNPWSNLIFDYLRLAPKPLRQREREREREGVCTVLEDANDFRDIVEIERYISNVVVWYFFEVFIIVVIVIVIIICLGKGRIFSSFFFSSFSSPPSLQFVLEGVETNGVEFWEIMGRYRSGVINMMQRFGFVVDVFYARTNFNCANFDCKYVLINGEFPLENVIRYYYI